VPRSGGSVWQCTQAQRQSRRVAERVNTFETFFPRNWTCTPIMDTHENPIRPSRSPRTLRGWRSRVSRGRVPSSFRVAQRLSIIGVVVAVAGTAHALRHAMLLEKFSTRMTCILHTAITVMNQSNRWRPALHGHHQRVCRNRRVQRVLHALSHDYPMTIPVTSAPRVHQCPRDRGSLHLSQCKWCRTATPCLVRLRWSRAREDLATAHARRD